MPIIRAAAAVALLGSLAGCVGTPNVAQPYSPYATPYAAPYATPYPTPYAPAAYPQGAAMIGSQCYAGAYTCALPAAGPVGTGCSCPGLGAPSYGTIR